MKAVLVTRSEPGASRTAERLREAGYEPVVLPLFELVDIGAGIDDPEDKNFIFTSSNALEVLRQRGWKPSSDDAHAWCVGERTAQAARSIGFRHVTSAAGGGAKLVQKIAEHGLAKGSRFRYFTTADRSFDVSAALSAHGFSPEITEIYRVEAKAPIDGTFIEVMNAVREGALLVYSKRSGDYLAGLIKENIDQVDTESVAIVSISDAATNMLLNFNWRGVYVSKNPDEPSMIARLDQVLD